MLISYQKWLKADVGMASFQCQKNKYYAQRFLHSKLISFWNRGKIKTCSDKQKLREFITCISVRQEMLKEVLQAVEKEAIKNTRRGKYIRKYKKKHVFKAILKYPHLCPCLCIYIRISFNIFKFPLFKVEEHGIVRGTA